MSGTTSSLIEKATAADIAELESYTIRCMDEKLPVGSDIASHSQNNLRASRLSMSW